MKRVALSALLVASLVPAAHAQYGMESMMNPMTMMNPMMGSGMMNPGMMMNPMTMMVPMTMMGGMGNPMTMMMPMTMMGAPMMGGMMNPSTMMMPMNMMGGMGGPQQYMANPYMMPQQPQGFFPMMPSAPAPGYGAPAYGYYPAMPQSAPAAMPFDPNQWMQMFGAPMQQPAPAPQK